ncbi:MAG: histidinol-phosphate transaminase [Propionibacteriaceae bacterium]
MDINQYLRDDLTMFGGYSSAALSTPAESNDRIWLNANESPWSNVADIEGIARRYPDPQPASLRAAIARMAGVDPENILLGRGSDELIDVMMRATCRPARDAIVISTPTFPMYEIWAKVQSLDVVDVPLIDVKRDFHYDVDGVVKALETNTNIAMVFLCTPGNPTGMVISLADTERVVAAAQGRAIVVVDEAYFEFMNDGGSGALELLTSYVNVVVLRTLSKAHALAGARIGYAIAAPELISAFGKIHAPYPIATPSQKLALAALDPVALEASANTVKRVNKERDRLLKVLRDLGLDAYQSATNFVLVRFPDPVGALAALESVGVIVRDARGYAATPDALRITVGTEEQNQLVIDTLTALLTDS